MEPNLSAAFDSETDRFCLGRMVTKIGLVRIGTMSSFRAAQARIEELARSWPGRYIVFSRNTGSVLAKASSASALRDNGASYKKPHGQQCERIASTLESVHRFTDRRSTSAGF